MSRRILEHPGFPHVERLLSGGAPTAMASDLLILLGVLDPVRAARNLQSLALHPAFPREDQEFLAQLLSALSESFEPERALSNFERLLETRQDPDKFLASLRRSAKRRSITFTLVGGSQFLTDTVLRHPEFLDWLLRPSTLRQEPTPPKMRAELLRWVREAQDRPDGPAAALRRFRQREYLRIGLRDLMRRAEMQETTTALSRLADASLETAIRIARNELEALYGKPRWPGRDGRTRACEFTIIGLGKLGGLELNFSSDIDLLFLYSSDEGGTTGVPDPQGGRRRGRLTNHEFHARLARRIISLVAETTEEGHVFRIDMRLRPEGSQGALVYSLRSYEVYYESWGETWERQALIKARPAAGAAGLGEAFLGMTRPFVYRRTLDMSALDEIGRIKDRINAQLASGGRRGMNVKLGEGGIREIEFITQAFQLIYGGKEPILQTPNTVEALSVIQALGLLPIPDCQALTAAYVFLRDVEHRVQVTHGLQTHELPTDPHGLTVLARKMRFQDREGRSAQAAFEATLKAHQDRVAHIFENLFRGREEAPGMPPQRPRGDVPPPSAETLEDSLSPGDLAPYSFRDPVAASAQLRLLRNGEPFQHVSARAKNMFDDFLPRLLYLTLELPDPDRAVANLNRFVEKGGGREAIFSLMTEQEGIFEILLRLFGTSDYLSEILVSQPGLLDGLLQPEMLTTSRPLAAIASELAAASRRAVNLEQRFRNIHAAKIGEELMIGMRTILGEADILETLADLTLLADAVLRCGLDAAREELHAIYGTPVGQASDAPAGFAVIGMGKLGSREMNFGSDLDLVFVYDEAGETDGRRDGKPALRGSVPNHEYFLKLATTLRDGLSTSLEGARSYAIDLRLRPEGQKGALVAPLGVFEKYFEERAETWERQALCRARFIAGSERVGQAFMELAQAFVYQREVPADLADQVNHIRGRIERELAREAEGHIDIKLGRGGITDIEFIVQYLQILHGYRLPSVRRPETFSALSALREAGVLEEEDAATLIEAYRFLRLVENRLRISKAQALHTFPTSPEEMEMVARRIAYTDDEEGSSRAKLLADYERHTGCVRRAYRKLLGEENPSPGENVS